MTMIYTEIEVEMTCTNTVCYFLHIGDGPLLQADEKASGHVTAYCIELSTVLILLGQMLTLCASCGTSINK